MRLPVLSLVALLAAAVAAYLGQQAYRAMLPTVPVAIARETIPAGQRIRADQLELRPVPPIGDAPVATTLDQVVDRVATTTIPAGAPIWRTVLADPQTWRLGAPPDTEIVAVPLRPERSVAGLRPGQRINLYRLPPPQVVEPPRLLLQDVPILRLGADAPNPGDATPTQAPVVLLALPPDQARVVVQAVAEQRQGAELLLTLAPMAHPPAQAAPTTPAAREVTP